MARLYEQLAHLWPLLSPAEDYAADADRIVALIDKHLARSTGGPDEAPPRDVVEFGAGGGHTLFYLSQDFRCTAVDLSDAMLENSRHINADVTHIVADMRNFQIDQQFDVVLIHDAIDYLTSEADIAATFACAARHLRPGGLLIVVPTYVTETFVDGESMEDENADDETEIRFVTRVTAAAGSSPTPSRIEMNLTIFIRDLATQEMVIETDRHVCGLFSTACWTHLMEQAGFSVTTEAYLGGSDDDSDDDDLNDEPDGDEPMPTFIGVKKAC